jgi:hypothetical protein
MRKLAAAAAFSLVVVCVTTATSMAQQPSGNSYFANVGPAPTVSPYLNLGVNEYGISNYPSLVRPLLNQRDAQARQALATARARIQSHGRDAQSSGGAGNEQSNRRPGHFMSYSHYYGGTR